MELDVLKSARMLTQDFPPNTNAYAILTAGPKRKLIVTCVNVLNTTTSAASFSLFLCKSGNTFANTTALNFNQSVAANTAVTLTWGDTGMPMDLQYTNNLGIQANTANAFCVTVVGLELA